MIAEFLAERAGNPSSWSRNLVLLGDFNIFKPEDSTMQALTGAGFHIPPELQSVPPTNTGSKRRFYDQIAFAPRAGRFETTGRAGVFNYYKSVFRDTPEERKRYRTAMGPTLFTTSKGKPRDEKGQRSYYRTYWRTHQMSDHLPMWIELKARAFKLATEKLSVVSAQLGGDAGLLGAARLALTRT